MNIETRFTQLYKSRLLLHIGFWIVCILLGFFGEIETQKASFEQGQGLHMIMHFIGIIAATYINLYVLVPRFLVTHRYQTYFVLVLLTVAISTLVFQGVKYLVHVYLLTQESPEETFFMFFHISFYCLLLMMITTMFYFLRRRMNMKDMELKLREIENQKATAELKALKAQINPHLLFNSLNNIYSLALTDQKKTANAVLELSDLMTYVLYDCQTEKIALSKEISFIRNYIELEKSRFEDSVEVNLTVDESTLSNVTVSPLLFLPFIENAFKHCNKSSTDKAAISISFYTENLPKLIMEVSNSCEPNQYPNREHKGVGLDNVKQRLEFLYPDQHQLEIKQEGNRFFVRLQLDLS